MTVTFIAVNSPCLDDVRCFTVNVNLSSSFLALASLYELRCDSKVRQVALASLLIDLELPEEWRQRRLWQSREQVVTDEDRSVSLAEIACSLFVFPVFVRLAHEL